MKDRPMDSVSALFAKSTSGELEEVAEGIYLLPGFGNCSLIIADEGAVVVDPGLFQNGRRVVAALRSVTQVPVRYVIYTHGHYDHAFGTPAILEDAEARGHAPPDIVGHVNVARRFARYRKTAGHIAGTYTMQFASWTRAGVLGGGDGGRVVTEAAYHPPTIEYEDRIVLSLGELALHCRHGKGETDDASWLWIPERSTIVGGDFIVSSIPNAGTPFRVQRYVLEWAEVLEEMAGLEPAAIVSGHGGIFRGAEAQEMLNITIRALRYLEDEVVRRLNAGQWYEEIVQNVDLPEELSKSRHLHSLYGCPSFAVHCILRYYTGWYDGNPSNLFPSASADMAAEVLGLAGGCEPVLARARSLHEEGSRGALQRALHLVDYIIKAGSSDADAEHAVQARALKVELLEARAEQEPSFIARNILTSAAILEAEALAGEGAD